MPAIPALIVSGFLGSGKTTLVQHLLAQAQAEGVKLAIISNEFGDAGIDRALLEAGEEGLVELDGGCVCCRLSDALGETLEMLLTQVKPDRLVLETSGVALPGEILVQFWRPPVDALISEEVVVVLVDGERFLRDRPSDETFLQQLEAADLILLTKCDLLEQESIDGAKALLGEITGDQPILEASHGQIAPELLFPPDPEGARKARRDPAAEIAPHTHEQFTTVELSFPEGVAEGEVRMRLLQENALRAKGFVRTRDGLRVVQGVGPRLEFGEPNMAVVPPELVGTVVIIQRVG